MEGHAGHDSSETAENTGFTTAGIESGHTPLLAQGVFVEKTDSLNEIGAALAKAKKSFGPIVKHKTAKMGSYSYKYADLFEVMNAVNSPLADQGLSIVQDTISDFLITYLLHSSGQFIKTSIPIIKSDKPGPQGYASSLTYARRYGICNLLGIVADDDDDGATAQREVESGAHNSVRTQKNDTKDLSTGSKSGSGNTVPPKVTQPAAPQSKAEGWFMSPPRIKLLMAIANENGWGEESVKKYLLEKLGLKSRTQLNERQFKSMLEYIKSFPPEIAK